MDKPVKSLSKEEARRIHPKFLLGTDIKIKKEPPIKMLKEELERSLRRDEIMRQMARGAIGSLVRQHGLEPRAAELSWDTIEKLGVTDEEFSETFTSMMRVRAQTSEEARRLFPEYLESQKSQGETKEK